MSHIHTQENKKKVTFALTVPPDMGHIEVFYRNTSAFAPVVGRKLYPALKRHWHICRIVDERDPIGACLVRWHLNLYGFAFLA
jgi:hypothetical protein